MATTRDGFVFAWGQNNKGQLGLGKVTDVERTPTQVKSLINGVKKLVCGTDYTGVIDN